MQEEVEDRFTKEPAAASSSPSQAQVESVQGLLRPAEQAAMQQQRVALSRLATASCAPDARPEPFFDSHPYPSPP